MASLPLTWDTGTLDSGTLSTVSGDIILHYRRLRRRGVSGIIPFSSVYSTRSMTYHVYVYWYFFPRPSVVSDDCFRVGDVRVRLPLPRPSNSLLHRRLPILNCRNKMGASLDADIHLQTSTKYVVNSRVLYALTRALTQLAILNFSNVLTYSYIHSELRCRCLCNRLFVLLTTRLDTRRRFDAC